MSRELSFVERFRLTETAGNCGPLYRLPADLGAFTVLEHQDSRLLVTEEPESTWTHWVLLQWSRSKGDGSDPQYSHIAHGEGPAGSLRESRHTYFGDPGEGGYVFYLNAELLCWALGKLKRWFDFT